MPYYRHSLHAAPETGIPSEDKASALQARQSYETVTFVATEDQRDTWHLRERRKFDHGTYTAVPWYVSDLYYHYAHVSLDHPGMIAYTPNDEFGVEDRQLRVRPGKYLQEFVSISHMSPSEIESYTAQVRAYTGDFQIATSPEDIVAVYARGPHSCMKDMDCVKVYGDSDLACAYLGDLTGKVTARCIVWPAKQICSRVYGDAALTCVLKAAGFTQGSVQGAKVRAIESRSGGYILPFIDGISTASLSHDGQWIILDNDGPLACDSTTGVTDEEDSNHCANCEDECESDETYCSDCRDNHCCCEECGHETFDGDSGEYMDARGAWFCDSCIRRATNDCEVSDCSNEVCAYHFSRRDWNNRVQAICHSCENAGCADCEACGEYVSELDDDSHCFDCRETHEPENNEDETPDVTVDFGDLRNHAILLLVNPCAPFVRISGSSVDPFNITLAAVEIIGPFAVHCTYTGTRKVDRSHYTVTHIPTGLAVCCDRDLTVALTIAHRLQDLPVSWDFTSLTMPRTIQALAWPIIQEYPAL